ncbi:hypothetical protein BDW02DRAFT_576116 [Decorospora gaudefroyi]|uniref:DUF7707 domain-containing protein n=1 Tax=Decorospora gaudefroyi TaxID=184978 RepID=A0A6A5KTL6_9PLEO|nr:hypothetical protein BDW02DRAFT_576116 [Decorospora gaudefroyi]
MARVVAQVLPSAGFYIRRVAGLWPYFVLEVRCTRHGINGSEVKKLGQMSNFPADGSREVAHTQWQAPAASVVSHARAREHIFLPSPAPPASSVRSTKPSIKSRCIDTLLPSTRMLYSTIAVAAAAFVGLASAQNDTSSYNTPIPCCSLDVGQISQDLRVTWCQANENTCRELCGGPGKLASNGNDCNSETLEYECMCSDETDKHDDLADYEQSVPGQMCRAWFMACNEAAGDDADVLDACERAEENECGDLKTEDATEAGNEDSASASSSATPSATNTDSPSGTQSEAATDPTGTGAAANLVGYGTPALVGGFLAMFGFVL